MGCGCRGAGIKEKLKALKEHKGEVKILHCFATDVRHGGHGLGDCVMFTSVLRHIKAQRPTWRNYVACGVGRTSTFNGLCEEAYVLGKQPADKEFNQVIWYPWSESWSVYHDWPSTKTTKCIAEQLQLICDWKLLRYHVMVDEKANELVDKYIKTLPSNKGFVLIHYQGNTSSGSKDIPHTEIDKLCNFLIRIKYTPVILDWDRRSPLPNQKNIFNPGADNPLWENLGTGDSAKIAALMRRSALNVCIDSGPGKIAMAVNTPCLTIWTKHHPIHFADNSLYNTTHLVPHNHQDNMRGDKGKGQIVFDKFYRYTIYHPQQMSDSLISGTAKILKVDPMTTGVLTAHGYNKDYYQQHQQAGLDYLNYGGWQKDYGKWIVDSFSAKGKSVLDVGCACGSIAAGMAEAGSLVSGCDLSQHMIDLGRAKWAGFPLFVCDAVNLHLWKDNTFDLIHSAQVFEHFKPDLVPFILKEINRVTKLGGIMFATFDTVELFARQNRNLETEDPTHVCVKPLEWWYPKLQEAGWELSHDLWKVVHDHPNSFFKQYDWEGICCRKVK